MPRILKVALTPGAEKIAEVKSELVEKGHQVTVIPELADYDLIIGPQCKRLTRGNAGLLKVMIKSARLRKYNSKGSTIQEDYEPDTEEL